METTIVTINNIDIVASNENNQVYVPIRPICEALGVNYSSQLEKIKSHPILAPVVPLRGTTGADGKQYEMMCLPLEYVFGWIFTINPNNVNSEARTELIRYQTECYHALYNYFFEKSEKYQAREKSFERTISLQNEQAALKAKPYKSGEDFERYIEIEQQLAFESSTRKSLTRDSITNIKTLFD